MTHRSRCPGCDHDRFEGEFRLRRQPVVLNYRFERPDQARRVPRRDISLRQCGRCGLVFNATFEGELIPYDQNYENRQSYSPTFQKYLSSLARSLTERHNLWNGRILEVGCGKGDFLRLICQTASARGIGFDTSYESGPGAEPRGVQFFRRYLVEADVPGRFDAVVCRHVIEHVGEIGKFLGDLRKIAEAAGDPIVVLETPRFEWIVRDHSVWDVVYEHCNYFPTKSLRYLCRHWGFSVRRQASVFGGQYQVIELQVARRLGRPTAPGVPREARLTGFARQVSSDLAKLTGRIVRRSAGRPWAIWGAGAKGVALANILGKTKPKAVVDSNPQKQGGFIPGTSIPIIGPDDPRIDSLGLIVVANPNYAKEIAASLRARSFSGAVEIL